MLIQRAFYCREVTRDHPMIAINTGNSLTALALNTSDHLIAAAHANQLEIFRATATGIVPEQQLRSTTLRKPNFQTNDICWSTY